MTSNAYGALRTDTTMTADMATYATQGASFVINAYSQITMTDGANPTIISGDSVTNETPNDPTQTYNGKAIAWDYTILVNDGVNAYEIGVVDYDINGNGSFQYPGAEQGYFLMFLDGQVPPLNTPLTIGAIVDNGPSIDVDTVVPCFVLGILIGTPNGQRTIEKLCVGDEVQTSDHGAQRIRWIGSYELGPEELARKAKLRPIKIMAGALGFGLPESDFRVSPQHRMLVRSPIAARMFDAAEVLVSAHKLVDLPGVFVDNEVQSVTYFHILFDQHEIIFAQGAPAESLLLGREALKGVGVAAREELFEIFPQFLTPNFAPVPARHIAKKGKVIANMLRRHIVNNKPLIAVQ
ncbi:Hint domain-containing protein [Falsihalocynthiibacter arcticus]|uniref:Calcium-binding protein n=1 Tax=Falsihalocynthiibacter arcticus TaxID=1579316 RepID=A0A126UYI7_9RHOB|nr:Hint domain-containing protein [Falsihalocynthiibacter arcticus]AML50499.1 calcium-binding protein [Falsihalocynthiibacter arcticus]